MSWLKVHRLKPIEDLMLDVSRILSGEVRVLEKREPTFEEAVAPGVSPQVPGSIGGMGNPVAPTPTSLGSGDNFNPTKRKKRSKKDKRVLEFAEFKNQFLK